MADAGMAGRSGIADIQAGEAQPAVPRAIVAAELRKRSGRRVRNARVAAPRPVMDAGSVVVLRQPCGRVCPLGSIPGLWIFRLALFPIFGGKAARGGFVRRSPRHSRIIPICRAAAGASDGASYPQLFRRERNCSAILCAQIPVSPPRGTVTRNRNISADTM